MTGQRATHTQTLKTLTWEVRAAIVTCPEARGQSSWGLTLLN